MHAVPESKLTWPSQFHAKPHSIGKLREPDVPDHGQLSVHKDAHPFLQRGLRSQCQAEGDRRGGRAGAGASAGVGVRVGGGGAQFGLLGARQGSERTQSYRCVYSYVHAELSIANGNTTQF